MMRTQPIGRLVAAIVVAAALPAAGGCKGECPPAKVDPTMKADLDNCLAMQKDQKQLITSLQQENTRLQTQRATAEVAVAIEGNVLTVKPGKPGDVRPLDDKALHAASQEFIDVVRRSRGAIQKCYEQALKANTGLQSRTVTVTVQASFSPQGQYQNASLSPSLGDTFDKCVRAVATKWTLSQRSPSMTFRAPVSLTPS